MFIYVGLCNIIGLVTHLPDLYSFIKAGFTQIKHLTLGPGALQKIMLPQSNVIASKYWTFKISNLTFSSQKNKACTTFNIKLSITLQIAVSTNLSTTYVQHWQTVQTWILLYSILQYSTTHEISANLHCLILQKVLKVSAMERGCQHLENFMGYTV